MRTIPSYHFIVALFVATVAIGAVSAQNKEELVDLSGMWFFNLGDNMKFAKPEYDDSDWEKIHVPSNWHREGFRNYHGYAWYRKRVNIDYNEKQSLILEIGKIDDVDEVYVNGYLIGRTGSFPPDYYTAWNYSRRYFIPHDYLNRNGKNVIAVRVYDEGGEGGILGTNVGIYSYENYSPNSFHLFGQWKFRLSDDAGWSAAKFDDSSWDDVIVPSTWESQGFPNYDGFGWYRKTFRLPDNFRTDELLLLLGRIDDMDEVYVNGQLVGRTGRIDRKWAGDDEYRRFRTYSVPDKLLRAGKDNVIAVRVYDQGGEGGIYEGPVTLLPQDEYKEFWKNYRSNTYNSGNSFLDWLSYYLD